MRFGSLFSGIGGLDLGLERAGMTCAWQVEIDEWCRRVLARHWPDVPRWDDATTFPMADADGGGFRWPGLEDEVNRSPVQGGRSARDDVGASSPLRVDLICGGFPCQPVSHAGKRLGQADDRWLWPEFARIVRVLRPRYVLVENVPGLLSRGMGDVLGDLAASGYDTEWDCIPAAAFGAPHLRYRVFIVAHAQGDWSLPIPCQRSGLPRGEDEQPSWPSADESGPLHDTNGRRHGGKVGSVFAGRNGFELSSWWTTEPDVGRVATRLSAGMDGSIDAHAECIEKASTAGVPQTNRLRALRQYLADSTASSESPRCAFCGHPLSGLPCQGACAPWRLVMGRDEAEDMRCLREGVLELLTRQGQDVQPFLSLGAWSDQREQAVGDRVQRLRGLGNAVVPQVAEWIGRRLMENA